MEKKYIPLATFFQNLIDKEITLTYKEIENIMGHHLPNTAYLNSSWWKKSKSPFTHFEAWTLAGYRVVSVHIGTSITFSKLTSSEDEQNSKKKNYIIREMEPLDCKSLILLKQSIYKNAEFDYYTFNEYEVSIQLAKKNLQTLKKERGGNILLSIINGHVAGYIEINRGTSPRHKHIAQIRFGVEEHYRNQGIGRALLKAAINWSKNNHIEKLEANVVPENELAMNLLLNEEFHSEGIRTKAFLINNTYFNELFMGKSL